MKNNKYLTPTFIGIIFCMLFGLCCIVLSIYGFIIGKSIYGIIFALNTVSMIFCISSFHISWKNHLRRTEYDEILNKQKIITSKFFKKISEVELDPFADAHIENDPTYSNQGGCMNAWRFKDDNEPNVKYYADLKKFKGLVIPKGITFVKHKYVESLVGDKKTPCDVLTNGGIDVDPLEGVNHKNKNCFGINCCDCIFFDQNANQRAEYFKQLQKEKENE